MKENDVYTRLLGANRLDVQKGKINAILNPRNVKSIETQLALKSIREGKNPAEPEPFLALEKDLPGDFYLCKDIYSGHHINLTKGETNQGIGIYGRSTGGKSNTGYQIASGLIENKVPWLAMDITKSKTKIDGIPLRTNNPKA